MRKLAIFNLVKNVVLPVFMAAALSLITAPAFANEVLEDVESALSHTEDLDHGVKTRSERIPKPIARAALILRHPHFRSR